MVRRRKNIVGKKFNMLTVISFDHETISESKNGRKNYRTYWKCKCDCGNIVVRRSDLISDKTRFSSCGCYAKKEKTKFMKEHNPNKSHGLTGTRLYKIYSKMHERCYRKNYHQFYLYGGRGIEICDEWLNHFKTFYDWAMSHGYDDNKSIDRINCNLNYSPENCRWADIYQQANNKRNNVVLTYKGNTMTLAEWARQLKLPYSTIADRYKKGKPITEILYPKKLRP